VLLGDLICLWGWAGWLVLVGCVCSCIGGVVVVVSTLFRSISLSVGGGVWTCCVLFVVGGLLFGCCN